MSEIEPTTDELRAAWQRAGLWRTGWSFERANNTAVIRQCLISAVKRTRRMAERSGQPHPTQPSLI